MQMQQVTSGLLQVILKFASGPYQKPWNYMEYHEMPQFFVGLGQRFLLIMNVRVEKLSPRCCSLQNFRMSQKIANYPFQWKIIAESV